MSDSLRYGTNSKDTSKWVKDLLNSYTQMPRGVFNLSHRKIFDAPIFGIIPFDSFELLPNSEMYLKYDVQMLSKNPTIKRLLSSMHVELATYKIDYNDTFEGWNNFITKGRSGKVAKSLPYVDFSLGTNTHTTCLPYSPIHYLNMAPSVFLGPELAGNKFKFSYNTGVRPITNLQPSGLTNISTLAVLKNSTAMRVNALPLVLYNKICKKYQNQNLLQDNPHWYPENENHDNLLPYDASGAVTTSDYDHPTKSFTPGRSIVYPSVEKNEITQDYESYPWLNVLQLANRKGTYLNSGSPFEDLIRGDVPTLDVLSANLDFSNIFTDVESPLYNLIGLTNTNKLAVAGRQNNPGNAYEFTAGQYAGLNIQELSEVLVNTQAAQHFWQEAGLGHASNGNLDYLMSADVNKTEVLKQLLNSGVVKGISFSMRQWRYLATMTVMKERLALCDGTYNSLIKAMFGHNPQWHAHEPTFCGGSTQPIVFSEVVNTADNGVSPLGETAGRAISSSQNSLIHLKSDDFGCYITVLIIIPDEYECQGVKKMWSRLENAEQYFPILNNLSPDATKNKEAFVSGDNVTDEDVLNYQERFAYYKSESNEVSGLMALPISKIGDVGAYVQNRILSSTPEFNQEYIRGQLTDNEKAIFASTDQAEFVTCVSIQKRYIAPIPEDSRPSDMGISY